MLIKFLSLILLSTVSVLLGAYIMYDFYNIFILETTQFEISYKAFLGLTLTIFIVKELLRSTKVIPYKDLKEALDNVVGKITGFLILWGIYRLIYLAIF